MAGSNIVRVFRCTFEPAPYLHPFYAGIVLREPLTIATRDGLLACSEFEAPGVKLGDRLLTSRDLLEQALATRPVYTAAGLQPRKD